MVKIASVESKLTCDGLNSFVPHRQSEHVLDTLRHAVQSLALKGLGRALHLDRSAAWVRVARAFLGFGQHHQCPDNAWSELKDVLFAVVAADPAGCFKCGWVAVNKSAQGYHQLCFGRDHVTDAFFSAPNC